MQGLKSNKAGDLYHWFKSMMTTVEDTKEQKAITDEVFFRFFNLRPDERILKRDDRFSESDIVRLKKAVQRLNWGEPVQHITGVTNFLDHDILVNASVLIPRPETEELVLWMFNEFDHHCFNTKQLHFLDIGTGSGCMAIAMASHFKDGRISAIDISEDALSVAKNNAGLNGVQIRFIHNDILSSEETLFAPGSLDCIFSNPPYVRDAEKPSMAVNVLDYEPARALFVPDNDPLLFYRIIARKAAKWLVKGGLLFVEINENLSDQCRDVILSADFTEAIIKKDIHGKDRFIKARM